MKWLVYALLLVNGAFFAFEYQRMSDVPRLRPQAVRPYDHVNRLLLMSETNVNRLRIRAPVPEPVVTAAAEPTTDLSMSPPETAVVTVQSCYSVGPLEDDDQVAAVRTWLVAMGGNPVLRVDERRELERYWVYFPPLPSLEEAQKEVERMRSEGIEDVIAVSSGDMINAISLGVFSQRSSLERRLEELQRRGYEPSIMPRYNSEKAFWVDVRFDQGEKLTQSEVSGRFPEVALSEASCISGEIARGGPGS